MTDDPLPYRVDGPCAYCGFRVRVVWPPDNPDTVDLECPDCDGWLQINRESAVRQIDDPTD